MHFIRRYAFGILVATALLLPFIFYSSDLKTQSEVSATSRIVELATRPIGWLFRTATWWVQSTVQGYLDLRGAREEAQRLTQDNSQLQVQIQMQKEMELENQRLKGLLNFVNEFDVTYLLGRLESADPSFFYKSLRLGRGEKEGVLPGMGVVAAEGVVGVVMRTQSHSSDVLLVTDPNSNLDVIVARNRRRAILEGSAGSNMRLKYAERGSRVQVGDEIITSGLTGAFPRGITVGQVVHISADQDGVSQMVEVQPHVTFGSLTEALILLRPSREIDVIRKVGGVDWLRRFVESPSTPSRSGG